jgi:large subunit ribosomal protein L27Ae
VSIRTNFDKYHPGYFGKVGMRHFHLTRNAQWNPTINVDKLWTLVPEEHKKDLKEDSQVVPVVNVLHHGYSKVLGNGQFVFQLGIFSLHGTEGSLGFPAYQ